VKPKALRAGFCRQALRALYKEIARPQNAVKSLFTYRHLPLVRRTVFLGPDDEVVVVNDNLDLIPRFQSGIPYPAYRQSNGNGALATAKNDSVNELSHLTILLFVGMQDVLGIPETALL
jgi:hypothetical protein